MSYPKYNEDYRKIQQSQRRHSNRRKSKEHSKEYVFDVIRYQMYEKNSRLCGTLRKQ